MSDPIKTALNEIFQQYLEASAQRDSLKKNLDELDTAIAKIQTKLVTIAAVCENIDPVSELGKLLIEIAATGLTDGIRMVLKSSDRWPSPTDIRTGLLRLGYDLNGYANVMATIHTVLKRLRDNKEITRAVKKPGREIVYGWATGIGRSKDPAERHAQQRHKKSKEEE